MHEQVFVLVVQPDFGIGHLIVTAINASGHEAALVSVASWALSLVRDSPPDVVLVERTAPGYEELLEVIDGLNVHVPVLVTQFASIPAEFRHPHSGVIAAIVRRAEVAAIQGY